MSKRPLPILRFEKGTRYYLLLVEKDLLGDWIVTKVNGRIHSNLGKVVHEAYPTYRQAMERYKALVWKRQFQRHYHLVN